MTRNFKFVLTFSVSLVFVFLLHLLILYVLNLPLFENKIMQAYLANFLIALFIYKGLYILKKKYNEQLGFLYMGGSFIKFILFFIIFYPSYKADGLLTTYEFMAFFIPYSISLIFETIGVINFIKK